MWDQLHIQAMAEQQLHLIAKFEKKAKPLVGKTGSVGP